MADEQGMDPLAGGSDGATVDVAPGVSIVRSALRMQFARSGGPGGQNVNKVNTKVELWVPVSALRGLDDAALARLRQLAGKRLTTADELHLTCETHRTQLANRQVVMQRLRELLVRAMHRPRLRRRTRPTAGSKRRRLEEKKRRGELKRQRRGDVV